MKLEDVSTAAQLQDLHFEQGKGMLKSTRDWLFVEPNQMAAMPFEVELAFGENRLERVLLRLDLKVYAVAVAPQPASNTTRVNLSSEVAFSLGTQALTKALTGKYGRPVTEDVDCASDIFDSIVRKKNKGCSRTGLTMDRG